MLMETKVVPAVRVLRDPKQIRALADSARREILRQLMEKPLTQSQLAKELNTTPSNIYYHLHLLSSLGLIRVQRTEIEPHGIQEKYYESVALLYIEDFKSVPKKYRKNFLQIHIERLRGVFATLSLLKKINNEKVEISRIKIEKLAQRTAENMSLLGEKYEKLDTTSQRETLIIEIYSKALEISMTEKDWKDIFVF